MSKVLKKIVDYEIAMDLINDLRAKIKINPTMEDYDDLLQCWNRLYEYMSTAPVDSPLGDEFKHNLDDNLIFFNIFSIISNDFFIDFKRLISRNIYISSSISLIYKLFNPLNESSIAIEDIYFILEYGIF